ncbi:MAG: hypothetical protein AAF658_05980, partial [Myxococcota bacterium]
TPVGIADVTAFFWSPDSALIAYIADADGEPGSELYLVAPDGSAQRKVSGDIDVGTFATW